MSKKRGNSLVIAPVLTTFSLVILLSFFITIINYIMPFIWYEKLNIITQKYIYVVEKFGELTSSEKKELEIDLINRGFDIENIDFTLSSINKEYGSLFEMQILYKYQQKNVVLENGLLTLKPKIVPLKIKKYGYIKSIL